MNELERSYPDLASKVGRETIALLPTPVRTIDVQHESGRSSLAIKCDNETGTAYGGNKVRKLEYALRPARDRHRDCIATFGAVGSNHALATAVYARQLGYNCTCFLTHQHLNAGIRKTLLAHLALGTEVVRYGGAYSNRLSVLRKHLWPRKSWVVPAGGSSWAGTLGFVNAGLELARQIEDAECEKPDRIYMATGTLGSAVGLSLGLALAGVNIRIEAIRVSMTYIANESLMQRLACKTAAMMRRHDRSVPADLGDRMNVRLRHEFFAGGYGYSNEATDSAVRFAGEQMNIDLETTYTGKAMAALLHDLPRNRHEKLMFWNTYNSAPLPQAADQQLDALPPEFLRYVE